MIEYSTKTHNQRERDQASLRGRKSANESLKCYAPGCSRLRYTVSRYCLYHRDRVSRSGHPTCQHPRGEEWKRLVAAGEVVLAQLEPDDAGRLEAYVRAAARRLWVPATEAIPPCKVHSKMTQTSKARIVLAWLIHKRNWTPERIIRLCLYVKHWVDQNVDHTGPRDREAFADHILGARLIQHAHVKETREIYRTRLEANPSWATHPYRRIEEIVKTHEYARFGPSVSKAIGKMARLIVAEEVGFDWLKRQYSGNN